MCEILRGKRGKKGYWEGKKKEETKEVKKEERKRRKEGEKEERKGGRWYIENLSFNFFPLSMYLFY